MDPTTLWSFISSLTRSISERRGTATAKVSDPTTLTYHIKKVRRFFSLCVLLFCTDDRCYLPLITDVVESLGGSTQLVQILNRLGMCSSADTLARSIQYRVQEHEHRGPEQECHPRSRTIVSADNIDFLHSYTQVLCGNQTSSWHGTTVQAVQPKPSLHFDHIGSLADTTNAQRVLALPSCTPGDTTTQGQTTMHNHSHHCCIAVQQWTGYHHATFYMFIYAKNTFTLCHLTLTLTNTVRIFFVHKRNQPD